MLIIIDDDDDDDDDDRDGLTFVGEVSCSSCGHVGNMKKRNETAHECTTHTSQNDSMHICIV